MSHKDIYIYNYKNNSRSLNVSLSQTSRKGSQQSEGSERPKHVRLFPP